MTSGVASEGQVDRLGDAVRQLVDAAVRTRAGADEREDVALQVQELAARLAADQRSGPAQRVPQGVDREHPFWWHNPVLGPGNPLAPPVAFTADADGVSAVLHLGSPYEGPPGYVHGGVLSLVLDQLLGIAALAHGTPGLTVDLALRYRAATPLFTDLRVTARVVDVVGRAVQVEGAVHGPDGVCVEASGTFLQLQQRTSRRLFAHLVAAEETS